MKTLRAFAMCLFTIAALATPGMTARAQMDSREAIDLQNQIAELRQELQLMQQAQQNGSQAAPSYAPQPVAPYPSPGGPQATGNGDVAAELVVRVSSLEEQVRDLQGKVDDLTNQLQRQHDDLTKQIGDLEFKLGQSGGGTLATEPGAPAGTPPDPVQPAPAKPAPPPPPAAHRTAEMILRDGNAALARRDFAGAAAAAREVLANAHGPRLTDAQFLLARAEGGQGQYKQSAADYFRAYQRAPKSATGQVALLGVANALLAMSDNKDACEALAKLSVEFPRAPAAVKENAAAARRKAGCSR